jgi:hemolysin activation/secretion protein
MRIVRMTSKVISLISTIACALLINSASYALPPAPAAALPGSVLPEVAGNNVAPAPASNTPNTLPPLPKAKPQAAQNALGAAATKIKFKLNKVILKGNKVYSDKQLGKLYQGKVGAVITVAELQEIVQNITNLYRNDGYILTRAILPPQHVAGGIVTIQIVEGYIDSVRVIGAPHGAKAIVQGYGEHIAAERPLQIKTMEHYLLLANSIPGVQVKAVLEPSKTNIGASGLNLVTQTKTFSGYSSYDDYGTRYIGPQEISLGGEMESIFVAGDSTQLNMTRTMRGQELKFIQGLYNAPIGTNGMRSLTSMNESHTLPGFVLTPLIIAGDAFTFYTSLQYPLIRNRSQNLTLDGTFNYIDSRVTTLQQGFLLYDDHLRTIRVGANYDISDPWNGANSLGAHLETGMGPFIGGTPVSRGVSGFTSRFGASDTFCKFEGLASRIQQFGSTRYSAFFIMKGQWSMEPLLASEQFSFGGAQAAMGRGYDAAEIIGDRGAEASIELRMNVIPGRILLNAAQLYVFYDAGVIWNAKDVVDQKRKQSATSAGFGSRFYFTKNISGNFIWAQPLTRKIDALTIIGDGRQPRMFFSITASV